MLPKKLRLNLKTSFKWTVSGKAIQSKTFKLFYRFGQNIEPKIGVSISSSQFKKAVLRNKAKRIFYNLAKAHINQLRKDLNLVIMPRMQVLQVTEEKLDEEFTNALSNIKTN